MISSQGKRVKTASVKPKILQTKQIDQILGEAAQNKAIHNSPIYPQEMVSMWLWIEENSIDSIYKK